MPVICKNCKKELVKKDDVWIHKDETECEPRPQKFCKSCNEPQYDKEICGCGYKYEIRED